LKSIEVFGIIPRADGWGGLSDPPLTAQKERDSSMVQIILIGLSAGVAAAFLFASIASGLLLSLVLFCLAPLPILIVGLGWSHWAGLIAALVASAGLAVNFKLVQFLVFLLGFGLPAWWLSYLALLARPVATAAGNVLEWYPIGRLVVWVAIVSALVVVAAMLSIGTSEEILRDHMREGVEIVMRRGPVPGSAPAASDFTRVADILLYAMPAAMSLFITMVYVMSLWLAGRIVNLSGRLQRPWPDISAMAFPAMTPTLLAAACAIMLIGGITGILSTIFAASLATAYAVLGFAVLHAITRGTTSRGLVLAAAYVAVIFIWPGALVLIALFGLADAAFDIRGRFRQKRGPPTLRT